MAKQYLLGNSNRLPLQRSTRSMSGPSSPGSASINRKGRPLFTSTDGPAILQTRSFRQSKLTWIIRDLWIPSVQSMGFGHTRFSSVGARCIMGGKLLRDFTGGTLSIPWLQSHSIRYREPSIPNDRAT